MSSTKDDGTAAATAQQLGSMSLGETAERKGEPENNEDADMNGTPTKKLCSKCGKESEKLMKCRACKCVWYCDKDCQNRHWKEHKIECKPIKKELAKRGGKLDLGTEEDLGPLPVLPPKEECPICMHALPLHAGLQTYFACCGKTICCACDHQHQMKSEGEQTCAFCRTAAPRSDEEAMASLRKRVELKDPDALQNMAMDYGDGSYGLPVDQAKCIDLLRQSADLGFPSAQYQLGVFYCTGDMGLEQNEEEGIKYYKEAAEHGHLFARDNLGRTECGNGNLIAAMHHFRSSAAGGFRNSMESLITCFENGALKHDDLSETLPAFYLARAEMRSEERDKYIEHLKKNGKYKAEYDL